MSFTGKHHSEETKQKMRRAGKGRVFSEEHCLNISKAKSTPEAIAHNIEAHTGRKRSDEARRNMSAAHQASPKTAIKMANLREFNIGKHANLGIPKSEAHKQAMRVPKSEETKQKMRESPKVRANMKRLQEMRKGKPLSVEHKENMRRSPKFRAHIESLHRDKGPTSIELFIQHCLTDHGGHRFEMQAKIPGFFESSGRYKAWDFLLPDKKLAVELDGTYWHSFKTTKGYQVQWDVAREYDNEHHAEWLGWRTVRISERVIRQSKPYKQWLRAQKSEHKEIRQACKPPRIRINLASKSIASKAAHFERVKARSLATAA